MVIKAATFPQPDASQFLVRSSTDSFYTYKTQPYDKGYWPAYSLKDGEVIAIHASKSRRKLQDALRHTTVCEETLELLKQKVEYGFVLGAVIGLVQVRWLDAIKFGGYELYPVEMFKRPIPIKGRTGFWQWEVPEEEEDHIASLLAFCAIF